MTSHRRLGYRFHDDWTEEELSDVKEAEGLTITRIVPVNIEIRGEHRVLNLDEALEYLDKAEEIWLRDCGCRSVVHHCNSPLNVCISWDSAIPMVKESPERNPRRVTKEKAIETLQMSHEAGLVHMAYSASDDKVNTICSCCSCCCAVLSSTVRFGLALHVLTSDTASNTDLGKCDSCGICVERCQFGARQTVDGSLKFDSSLCLGCGLCVTTCPVGAIELVRRQNGASFDHKKPPG